MARFEKTYWARGLLIVGMTVAFIEVFFSLFEFDTFFVLNIDSPTAFVLIGGTLAYMGALTKGDAQGLIDRKNPRWWCGIGVLTAAVEMPIRILRDSALDAEWFMIVFSLLGIALFLDALCDQADARNQTA